MALRMLRPFRRDGEFERLRRRHLPAVYRYALAVLPGEVDARDVTTATFERARERLNGGGGSPPPRRWLVDTAHGLARLRTEDAHADDGRPLDGGECNETERLLSRALDGGVPRADRRRLRDHLARCTQCRARERSYLTVRRALRSLSAMPVPAALFDTGDEPRFTSSTRRGSLASENPDVGSRMLKKGSPMGIVNRRNAVLGWAAWRIGKRVARRKAKSAVPSIDADSKRPNKPALAAAVAALVGGLVFWKRQKGGGDSDSTE
jgi:DNA-directed RNA polymerase specialized sigma24 family protein